MAYIKTNTIRLYYEKAGQGDPIVFLHGYTGSGKDWKHQVSVLSDRYTTITIDHRGHGQSEAPPLEEAYSINTSANDIYNVLITLGFSRYVLVGHSMGGFMALQLTLEHPELVSALVLVDTSSGNWDLPPGYDTVRSTLDHLARDQGLDAAFEYEVENNPIKKNKFLKHPELREIARQKVLNTSVDGYIYFPRAFKKWAPVSNRLNEIAVPVLIFLGEEDTAFIKASQVLKNAIKNAELKTIPDAGHNPHEESPEIFNTYLLEFLKTIR